MGAEHENDGVLGHDSMDSTVVGNMHMYLWKMGQQKGQERNVFRMGKG